MDIYDRNEISIFFRSTFPDISLAKMIRGVVKIHFRPSKTGVGVSEVGNTGFQPVFPLSRRVKQGNRRRNGPETN